MTISQSLLIGTDMCVWMVGNNVETSSIVDPLPEGSWSVEERVPGVDALIVGTDHRTDLVDIADDVIPQIGSIRIVWVVYPHGSDIDNELVQTIAEDYGWQIAEAQVLDDMWYAIRLIQP